MNEFKVGIFATAALVILGFMILVIGDINLGTSTSVIVDFPDALGIKEGEKVYLSGLRTGQVVGINYSPPERRVYLTLRIDGATRWPDGSQFAIDTLGLMGEKFVGIEPLDFTPVRLTPDETENLKDTTSEISASQRFNLLRTFTENEDIVLTFRGISHYGMIRRLFRDGSMIAMMESFPQPDSGSQIGFHESVSLGLACQRPEVRECIPYMIEPHLSEIVVEIPANPENFIQGQTMEVQLESDGRNGAPVQVASIVRPPRGRVENTTIAGLTIGDRIVTVLVLGLPARARVPESGTSIRVGGSTARVSGRLYLGTRLLGMGDLMKTGRDVLRRVHAGVETADRLLTRLTRVIDKSKIEDRIDEMAENFVVTSRDIRESAGTFRGVVDRVGKAADKVGSAAGEAGDTLRDFSVKAGKMVDRLGTAVDGIREIVDGAKPEVASSLKEFRAFSKKLRILVDEGGEDFKKMASNLSNASERVDRLMQDVDYKGPAGKKIADLLDSMDGFSTDMGQVAGKVRELLGDRELGSEIRSTMKGIGSLTGSVQKFIGGLRSTRYDFRAAYFGGSGSQEDSGDLLLDIYPGGTGRKRITLGAEGIGFRDTVRATWGVGTSKRAFTSLGVMESRMGIGFQARLGRVITGIEALDPRNFRVNAELRLLMTPDFSFRLKYRDITSQIGDPTLHVGVETLF
ncbi:MAG: hypothetical protein CVV64_00955 [Candidatus Wallbacteria bacterium HGW-Wallbacteria-1]|jgi:ABC-type transporter Mla subunit MlaD|uniref:Mce/MlaD domain-containing protein n=1 Tax=Candidatus Wallbacteria bacterium HGW-Wallbacteria-1 TaxID=2013854 RepID=A0A2N1PUM9_9BACT|nr:MAG: hypothetical protein CVV64_00955 [Candidatus Wallbacteria bacterium HGW-Wallbacteria-1]